MPTPHDAYVVDLQTHPGAFPVILGETSSPYGLIWTLWAEKPATIKQLDRVQFRGGYLSELGFKPRGNSRKVLETIGWTDYARMNTLIREINRLGGIVLLRPPYTSSAAVVASHLGMMQDRHGWDRVGYLDSNRKVTVLDASGIEGGFRPGDRVRSDRGDTGTVISLGTIEGEEGDPLRVASYRVQIDSRFERIVADFYATELSPLCVGVPA